MYIFKGQCYWFTTVTNLFKEFDMFDVSEKAGEVIKGFLAGKEGPQAIRIMMNEGG